MPLPSVVTLGSLAFVVAAGAGYALTSTAAADTPTQARHSVIRSDVQLPPKPMPRPRHAVGARVERSKPDAVPQVLVVVFNNTGITGLAAAKAATLEGAGWNVASTGNWYGAIPGDTVYYPSQLRSQAVKLAKVLHITRLRPAVAPMQFDRLTVILASG